MARIREGKNARSAVADGGSSLRKMSMLEHDVPCKAGKLTSWLHLEGGPRRCPISQSNKRCTRKKGIRTPRQLSHG